MVFLCMLIFLIAFCVCVCMFIHEWFEPIFIIKWKSVSFLVVEADFLLMQGFFCCASTVPVWMPWTCGSSPRCTRLLPRTAWRSARSCWATAPIPPWSTATARAPWTWLQRLSSGRDWPVSASRLKTLGGGCKGMLSFQATFLELQKWMQGSRVAADVPRALKCTGTSDTSFVVLPGFLKFRIIKALLNQWLWDFF